MQYMVILRNRRSVIRSRSSILMALSTFIGVGSHWFPGPDSMTHLCSARQSPAGAGLGCTRFQPQAPRPPSRRRRGDRRRATGFCAATATPPRATWGSAAIDEAAADRPALTAPARTPPTGTDRVELRRDRQFSLD